MRRARGRPIPNDAPPGRCRCGCGRTFNGYVWGSCPQCDANEKQMYALRCVNCRNIYFSAEKVDHCPDCGSGNTACIAEPDEPAVR